ncbi:MAG: hypothetical protein EOM76_07165 [Sphingobacteriia bacterium]|nr:hypothetical protein [Sphingobacteriia bacterium]
MKNGTGKLIIIGLGISGAIYAITKAASLKAWYDALNVSFKARIATIRNSNLVLNCDAILDNPKNTEITISKPTIRIYNGADQIAYSKPTSEKVVIKANAITTIPYQIEIPLVSGALYKMLLQAGKNVVKIISNYVTGGQQTGFTLGIKLDVVYYMSIFSISRKFTETIEI